MKKRKLEELNLLDNFLFGSIVTYPGIGEEFSRALLKTLFRRDFGHLTVFPQRIYYGEDTTQHGSTLDLYIEEDILSEEDISQNTSIYDIEPEKDDRTASISALPRRVRFYHSKIDARSLKSGESYRALKNVIIIMITPFDPFGLDRMVYTICNKCSEEPSMPYEDGQKTLFLYTKGKSDNPPEELRQLLTYMEHTTKENAVNNALQDIHRMVETVKQDKEVSLQYMKITEREDWLRYQGREEERANTERERKRAEVAEADKLLAEAKIQQLEAEVQALRAQLPTTPTPALPDTPATHCQTKIDQSPTP